MKDHLNKVIWTTVETFVLQLEFLRNSPFTNLYTLSRTLNVTREVVSELQLLNPVSFYPESASPPHSVLFARLINICQINNFQQNEFVRVGDSVSIEIRKIVYHMLVQVNGQRLTYTHRWKTISLNVRLTINDWTEIARVTFVKTDVERGCQKELLCQPVSVHGAKNLLRVERGIWQLVKTPICEFQWSSHHFPVIACD